MKHPLLAALLLALTACGDGSPLIVDAGRSDAGAKQVDAGVRDAGVAADSGVFVDSGTAVDAGAELDSGVAVDSGVVVIDAGAVIIDAGSGFDAGPGIDAGSGPGDSGVVIDAGATFDAGMPVDAGTFCQPGASMSCYSGPADTLGIGLCHTGQRTCDVSGGAFGPCLGEVLPAAEICGNGLDEDCTGIPDNSLDQDGDGFTVCAGDCCDAPGCADAGSINPGAFEVAGNTLDDDCNGAADEVVSCDTGLALASNNALDAVKALDWCKTVDGGRGWGVVSAAYRLTSGDAGVVPISHGLHTSFGPNVLPRAGASMVALSTGAARVPGQSGFVANMSTESLITDSAPAEWVLDGGPATTGTSSCPPVASCTAASCLVRDPMMLEVTVRVPTNARAVRGHFAFFSKDYPESVCSPFADQFIVLLTSAATTNPADHNIARLAGVTVGANNQWVFSQCVNGRTGCNPGGIAGTQSTCISTGGLLSTGFDAAASGVCDSNSLLGGGSGWLTFAGNVVPGELATLRLAIWDSGDSSEDSTVVLDSLEWLTEPVTAGGSF